MVSTCCLFASGVPRVNWGRFVGQDGGVWSSDANDDDEVDKRLL